MADGIEARAPFGGLAIAASGMSAQRARMDAVASNIANADTTRVEGGGPYRRKVVALEEVPFSDSLAEESEEGADAPGGVRVTGVSEDAGEGPLVYDPSHPDADANGWVRMPNVRVPEELADLMDARNLFEANASVFMTVRSMLRRATQL